MYNVKSLYVLNVYRLVNMNNTNRLTFRSIYKGKKIQKELKELEKTIYPKYQETVSILKVQRADLDKNSKKWKHKQNIGTEK